MLSGFDFALYVSPRRDQNLAVVEDATAVDEVLKQDTRTYASPLSYFRPTRQIRIWTGSSLVTQNHPTFAEHLHSQGAPSQTSPPHRRTPTTTISIQTKMINPPSRDHHPANEPVPLRLQLPNKRASPRGWRGRLSQSLRLENLPPRNARVLVRRMWPWKMQSDKKMVTPRLCMKLSRKTVFGARGG
jgi:hypothetical protein